jgi:hypothetical protein
MNKSLFPMCYEVSSGLLAITNGASSPTLTFSAERDFLLRYIRTTGNTGVKIQIAESSGRAFSNQQIQSNLIGGNATNQGIPVVDPIVIPKGTQLSISFTNNDSSTHTEYLQLWGIEIDG